ncbi:M61 family metallopeptidase [Pendulispora albinea]|uniref:M61 family peptidase n=1 Tax=Pendulispora albinea TaxID=2741071 RepID=A0ABZ2LLU9_9BACT
MRKTAGLHLLPIALWLTGCAPDASAAPAAPTSLAGPMTVRVDARDVPQMILHAKIHVPARPGPITLVYPKWIPGNHGPTGKVADISGLRFSAGGKALAWQRDPEQISEFSMTLPAGSTAVDVELDVVVDKRWLATADVSEFNWNRVLLYPKGTRARDVQVEAAVDVPANWHWATALPVASQSQSTSPSQQGGGGGGGTVSFKPVSLETLVDSPVVMGRYGRTIDLGTALGASHSLELVAETKEALEANDKQIALYRRLIAEATSLFGARHYDKYTFLYILTGDFAGSGLEHHASSQNLSGASLFSKDDTFRLARELLPHEFAHSWNGKYRRPKGLATDNYQQPMHNELLWVYEGLTDYYGWLLAARSGLGSVSDAKDQLALVAATLDSIPGRKWRSLADTTYTPAFGQESNRPWYSAQRAMDYYPESLLIWLEVDTLIRQKTGGKRSLDDFSRAFFGGQNTGAQVKPYELADVLKALGDVAAHDWKGFFEQRIMAVAPHAPLGGIEGSGYKLVYQDKPNELRSSIERVAHFRNERTSLGFVLNDKGVVQDLSLEGPAARAGLLPDSTIVAVNGRKYSADVLEKSVLAAKGTNAPIELITEKDGYYRTLRVSWNGGLRVPRLERDPAKPDVLAAILAPRTQATP